MSDADKSVGFDLEHYRKDHELDGLLSTTADDIFRWLHYHGGDSRHFTTDIDMVWVDAEPSPHVASIVEYKNANETVSFPQAVFFEAVQSVMPVYIIRAKTPLLQTDPEDQRFDVERVHGWNRDGVDSWVETETVREDLGWGREISGIGDLDPDYHGGILAFEDQLRGSAKDYNGNALAAVDPEDITSWSYRMGRP